MTYSEPLPIEKKQKLEEHDDLFEGVFTGMFDYTRNDRYEDPATDYSWINFERR